MKKTTKVAVLGLAVVIIGFGTFGANAEVVTTSATATATSTCPMITKFMKLGEKNDRSEVIKLQTFLKNSEKMDVDVTGIFDEKTESGVKVFQKKYEGIILAPWGATKASGKVYITTAKQINKIACGAPLTLDTSEIKIISSYKGEPSNVTIIDAKGSTWVATKDDSDAKDQNSASVVNASVASRFVNFLKGLFR